MEYLAMEFWEILLDVIGICLCSITVLYLVKNKFKNSQVFLKEKNKGNSINFDEILSQLVRQSEHAFETISDTIKKECRVLNELMEKEEIKKEKVLLVGKEVKQIRERFQKKNQKDPGSGDSGCDKYGEVVRLANSGLSIKEISERLKIPKGEIELTITLRKMKTCPRGVA